MRKITGFLFVIVAVIAAVVSLGGWNLPIPPLYNEIHSVQTGTTIVGIGRALNGRAGTVILHNGANYVFGWSIEDAWAFVCLNTGGTSCASELAKMNGNLVNAKSMRDVARHLVDNLGWKFVAAEAVPSSIRLMYMKAAATYAATAMGETTIIVMPAGGPSLLMDDYIDALERIDT